MYTQCPDCETVFRISADTLRAAGGNVRCGVCSTSFSALDKLSEEPFEAGPPDAAEEAPEDTITVEELPGSEVIELSAGDEAAASEEPSAGFQAEYPAELEGVAGRQPEVDGDATALEQVVQGMPEAGPAAEAGVGTDAGADPQDPAAIAAALTVAAPLGEEAAGQGDESPSAVIVADADVLSSAPAAESGQEPFEIPRILIPEEMRRSFDQAPEAAPDPAADFAAPAAADGRRRWPWVAAAAGLVLLLAAQVVHSRRDDLLRQPVVGPLLARAYSLAGLPLAMPTDLAAYELRQWGAASDASQPGRLRLRACVTNRASFSQPYPWLRIALQDRFGTTIGARDVAPDDYLPGTGASSLLGPGQRADAEIVVVDPGPDAVGFELDVCLPSAGDLRCAGDVVPAGL